jgi:MFS transporter, DHA1 family, inner membrane transport protein
MPRLLLLFALCNFVIGTGAFGLTGILSEVATALDSSVGAVGQTMTAYAFATALLAPFLMVATGRWSRRSAMLLALGLFAAGTLVSALAVNLGMLLVGRVLMGAGALFTPVAAGVAVALVPPEKRGKALSLTFLGMSLSYVFGLPFGAWLGIGFGWRWPMLIVTVLAVGVCVLVARLVPRDIQAPGASFQGLGTLLRQREVLLTLLLTLCYFVSIFVVFSYIGPVQLALNPLSPNELTFTLMLFGVAGVLGTISGGWASDLFGPQRTLVVQLSVLGTMMLLVPLTQGIYWFTVAVFMVWGVCGFGMMTPQQARLAQFDPPRAPLLLSINTSMLYFGTALGAAIGGAGSPWLGFAKLSWLGVVFAGIGLLSLLVQRPTLPPIRRQNP